MDRLNTIHNSTTNNEHDENDSSDNNNNNAKGSLLHEALIHLPAPARIIEALIRHEPDSTLIQDSTHGRVPLAYACANGASDEIIFQLLHGCARGREAASVLDDDGRSALHHACNHSIGISSGGAVLNISMYTSAETIRMLLEVDPTLAMLPDNFGCSPLKLFWDSHHDVLCSAVDEFGEYEELDEDVLNYLDLELSELYWAAKSLLKAFTSQKKNFKMLSSVVSLVDCPDEFVFLAIKLNRGDARLADERGNLPLHVLAALPQASVMNVSALISIYPEAVRIADWHGRLPFEVAYSTSRGLWNGVIEVLLEANPGALEQSSLPDSAFPYILSNTLKSTVKRCQPSRWGCTTAFEIMKNRPSLVQGACLR